MFSSRSPATISFYCMLLLTAMFVSTCYWPPLPIDTPLVRPWAENVTTFADGLRVLMPNVPVEKIPTTIPIADRCWCDLSGGFFNPINTTKWEELSVARLRSSIEREMALERRERERKDCEESAVEGEEPSCEPVEDEPLPSLSSLAVTEKRTILELLWILTRYVFFKSRTNTTTPVADAPTPAEDDYLPEPILVLDEETQEWVMRDPPPPVVIVKERKGILPLLPPEYDLRKFGFGMVLDLGWPDSGL